MKKRFQAILGILAIFIVTIAFLAFTYFNNYYSYGTYARKALISTDTVQVERERGYIFFDGPGTGRAMIFYPGAKVATEAYAPLMAGLAEKGIDCFLVDMPLHFALFDIDRAGEISEAYEYDELFMGGHSMGGAMASRYLAAHTDNFSGLILLGSYPIDEISDDIKFLSVIGSADGIVDMDDYEDYKKFWPKDGHEVVIFGGNHAGFGNYGKQDGDGEAKIKQKTQWRQTIEAIMEYM